MTTETTTASLYEIKLSHIKGERYGHGYFKTILVNVLDDVRPGFYHGPKEYFFLKDYMRHILSKVDQAENIKYEITTLIREMTEEEYLENYSQIEILNPDPRFHMTDHMKEFLTGFQHGIQSIEAELTSTEVQQVSPMVNQLFENARALGPLTSGGANE